MLSRSTLFKLSLVVIVVVSLGWYLQPAFDPLGSGSEDRALHEMGETFEVDGLFLTVVPPNESAYFATKTTDIGYSTYFQIALKVRTRKDSTTNIDLTDFSLTNPWRYPYELKENASINSTRIANARDTRTSPITNISEATIRNERKFILVYKHDPINTPEAWFRVKNESGKDHYVNITTEPSFAEELANDV